jgi:hypothetical protein
MKTAYELAMERLARSAPTVKLDAGQKKAIADLESQYKAKLAQREIFLQGELDKAIAKGDMEAHAQLEKQLSSDRKSIHAELEEKREEIRRHQGRG